MKNPWLLVSTALALSWLGCGAGGVGGGAEGEEDDWMAEAQSTGKTIDRRFELATRECGAALEAATPQCRPSDQSCLCSRIFDQLNRPAGSPGNPSGKFIVLGGATYRAQVLDAGNEVAHVVNSMNQCRGHERFEWSYCTGRERARQIMEDARAAWGGAPPRWFLLNEMASPFRADTELGARYREWVINLARALRQEHGRTVVLFTWFRPRDTAHKWAWTELGKVAHLGVEMYLSAREIRAAGFSQGWCEDQYRDWRRRFVENGVPASRIILTEHFGETGQYYHGKLVGWGRAGVPEADWRKALRVRTRGAAGGRFCRLRELRLGREPGRRHRGRAAGAR